MMSYSSFRGLGKQTGAHQTGFLDSTRNRSEVKKSVWLIGVSLPNPLNDEYDVTRLPHCADIHTIERRVSFHPARGLHKPTRMQFHYVA